MRTRQSTSRSSEYSPSTHMESWNMNYPTPFNHRKYYYCMLGNFHDILSSADIFKHNVFQKILCGITLECQNAWIQIRTDNLSVLIWVQIVCKGYQQTKKFAASRQRVLTHLSQMDSPTLISSTSSLNDFQAKGCWQWAVGFFWCVFFFSNFVWKLCTLHSEEWDQRQCYAPDLGLHCLPRSHRISLLVLYELTLHLLVLSADNQCKQYWIQISPTEFLASSGSKVFDNLMVFLKEIVKKVYFEKKKISRRQKSWKISQHAKCLKSFGTWPWITIWRQSFSY